MSNCWKFIHSLKIICVSVDSMMLSCSRSKLMTLETSEVSELIIALQSLDPRSICTMVTESLTIGQIDLTFDKGQQVAL